MNAPTATWAEAYVSKLRLALVPIPPGRKAPLGERWNKPGGYIADVEEAHRRWEGLPDHGIGVVLSASGLCSIDVDSPDHAVPVLGDLGIDLDAEAAPTIQGNPTRFRTMFRAPPGIALSRKTLSWPAKAAGEKPITVFELRAGDIQDILPPTLHPQTGRPYTWLVPPSNEFPPLPEALLELWANWDSYRRELEGLCPWAKRGFNPEPAPRGDGSRPDVIAAFNRAHPVEEMLEAHAYTRRGKRWLSPTSSSGLAGVTVLDDGRRVYSHHASDPLSDGHAHDSFDIFRIMDHAGDTRSAVKAAAEKFGIGAKSKGVVSEGAEEWPDPQPLSVKVEPEPYPLDALPKTIQAAVKEVQGFIKAPVSLVASSALAAVSLANQSYIDVRRANKLEGPTGLFSLTIADSGERKTTSDGFFMSAIREYEAKKAESLDSEIKKNRGDIAGWKAEYEGVLLAIKDKSKKGRVPPALMEDLRELQYHKPEPLRVPRLLRMDDTPESLAWSLAKEWPSAGVISNEAGIVFGAHAMGKDSIMRNLAQLNILWDGGVLPIGRRTSESFTVKGARLTMGLQIQEMVLRSFFDQSKGLARGIGFLARFLIAWPESTQGFRPFSEAPENWPDLAAFHRGITKTLDQEVPIDASGALTPVMLDLPPKTKAEWVKYHDDIEAKLRNGGELYDVRDTASKTADNAVRLGSHFQVFEHGMGGGIGLEAFEGAGRIVAWHLSCARRFFGELALPTGLDDAARLDSWLREHCRRERTCSVTTMRVQQYGPRGLRDKAAIEAAVGALDDLARARLVKEGRHRRIEVNPALVEGKA
jgi:hypothetical protein